MSKLPEDNVPEGPATKSTIGAILFAILLLLFALGIISFATEYFLGKPLSKVIQDFLFLIYHKQK